MAGDAATVASAGVAVVAHLPSTGVSPSRLHAVTGGNHHVLVRGRERPPANSATLDCVTALAGRVRHSRSPGSGQST
jgi:hypothetical protein